MRILFIETHNENKNTFPIINKSPTLDVQMEKNKVISSLFLPLDARNDLKMTLDALKINLK